MDPDDRRIYKHVKTVETEQKRCGWLRTNLFTKCKANETENKLSGTKMWYSNYQI